ncbi:hypothetical protein [Saccharopolyspora aridisoli]|uniref:hypothetical protein n=1 Tax=Saccharopolyspora aridisoli TaxID=2530385 RepID=UPI00140473C4|nr:hypothetical protein [Saccharopolyspora aridisoli]
MAARKNRCTAGSSPSVSVASTATLAAPVAISDPATGAGERRVEDQQHRHLG